MEKLRNLVLIVTLLFTKDRVCKFRCFERKMLKIVFGPKINSITHLFRFQNPEKQGNYQIIYRPEYSKCNRSNETEVGRTYPTDAKLPLDQIGNENLFRS